jgi:hypothetical protein
MLEMELAKLGHRTAIVCGSVTLLIAAGLGARDLYATNNAAQTKAWPVSDGIVIERKNDDRSLTTLLTYEYKVDNKEYRSHRIWFDQPEVQVRGSVDEKLYQVGRSVKVRYNPKEPQTAVLSTEPEVVLIGHSGKYIELIAFGALLIVAAFVRRSRLTRQARNLLRHTDTDTNTIQATEKKKTRAQ